VWKRLKRRAAGYLKNEYKKEIAKLLEYKNRAEIIKSALREYIGRIENIEKLKERVTELYLADKVEYNELVIIIGRQNAESVKHQLLKFYIDAKRYSHIKKRTQCSLE
jgi:metal-responsive CopG/Arc/MetJ family transcriptional regulator